MRFIKKESKSEGIRATTTNISSPKFARVKNDDLLLNACSEWNSMHVGNGYRREHRSSIYSRILCVGRGLLCYVKFIEQLSMQELEVHPWTVLLSSFPGSQ